MLLNEQVSFIMAPMLPLCRKHPLKMGLVVFLNVCAHFKTIPFIFVSFHVDPALVKRIEWAHCWRSVAPVFAHSTSLSKFYFLRTHARTHSHTHSLTHTFTLTHTHIRTHTHTHILTHTYSHTHTHTHTYTLSRSNYFIRLPTISKCCRIETSLLIWLHHQILLSM